MPDQSDPDDTHDDPNRHAIPPLFKAYIDKQIQDAHNAENQTEAKKKKWKNSWRSASPITKGTFILTASVAIATTAYVFIAAFQLHEMRHTNNLTEQALAKGRQDSLDSSAQFQAQIHHYDATLGQTQEIAKQTLAQARQTSRLADDTHDLANAAKAQSKATANIAAATAGEVKAMQTQLEFSQRAWIRFEDLKPLSDLTFEDDGMHLRFDVSYINLGNLPATNVSVQADVVFEHWGKGNGGIEEITMIQKSVCERASTVFPESRNDSALMYPGPPARDFDDSTITPISDAAYNTFKGTNMKVMQPIIVGCISYRFLSSPQVHYTGFIVQVQRKTGDPKFPQPLVTTDSVPIQGIQMTEYYFAGKISD
jgi:hypothetical protein